MRFRDIGLKTKFMFGQIFPMFIFVFLAVSGVWTLHRLNHTIHSLDRITNVKSDAAHNEGNLSAMESALLAYLLSGEEKRLKGYESIGETVSSGLAEMKKRLSDDAKEVEALTQAEQSMKSLQEHISAAAIERRKGMTDLKAVSDLYLTVSTGEAKRVLDGMREALASLRKTADEHAAEQVAQGLYYSAIMEKLVIYGVVVAILLSLLISYWLGKKVADPLERAVALARDISKGDLTRRLNIEGKDEVGRLGSALDQMVDSMRGQAKQMSEGVQVLSASASEIAATVAQLAQSTSKTSVAVTETNATVEQVKQAAELARQKAKNVAETANKVVQTSIAGKTATDDTSQRMRMIKDQMESIGDTVVRLSEHSRAIEEIIATVKDLADQSNLLAVNASIEASRAGEHGKGFAVVAHEIKALADQSGDATDQVRSILKDTSKWVSAVVMATEQGNKAVEAGVQQSGIAGNSIQELANSVAASAQSASVIETTSEQQTIGVEQVAEAMANIVQAMQQNEAGTLQIEEATKQLTSVGSQLEVLVHRFKL
ncbi:MAG: methyl-accepting chemotaxis protein [Desulfomonilaceae bacterium]|nr:methyl-accepting chemotaxis protein [Desulfomonilaceae bacterium]